jgi:tetratricopeptide (TPR) repeat protein
VSARANALPGDREKRRVNWIRGVLATERGDTARAIEYLRLAEAALSPRGLTGPPPPHHAPIWFDLASAYLAAGDLAQAEQRFQRLIDSTEWLAFPVQYVRSLYFLGQIAEKRGDLPKARAFYQRFVDAWGGGDIDPARVAEARKKIS